MKDTYTWSNNIFTTNVRLFHFNTINNNLQGGPNIDISCVIIICNKFNKRNVRQRVRHMMYQPIIEGHIKFIKSKASSFKDATFFNPNACPCDGDVLMNLNV